MSLEEEGFFYHNEVAMFGKKKPQSDISVCIPVYNTERYLEQCLQSVIEQDFPGVIEVIVVSDSSPGRDETGRTAEKIVKDFRSKNIRYLENSQNLSLIETRRLVNEAKGKYIYMLDSDDFLPSDALSPLYDAAIKNDADIVQGDCVTLDAEGKNHIESTNEVYAYDGILEGKEVFDACFCDNKYRAYITTKLIKTEIYQKAFEEIPYIKVHMAEEVIQYFFIALYSKKYVGIRVPVYNYRIAEGITVRRITSLEDWQKVCSTASIITALFAWVEEKTHIDEKNPLDEKEMKALQQMAKAYCVDNVKQLRSSVTEELYKEARSLLCDYWGEQAVVNTEEFLEKITDSNPQNF